MVTEAWPRADAENYPWSLPDHAPRSARRRFPQTYTAVVTPEIASVDRVPLSADIETSVVEASAEIARFDADVGAEIAPFASLLLRSEAAASSKIENLTASAKAIALAELGDRSRRNAELIVANTRSMQAAIQLADHLDEQTILAMHYALLSAGHPEWCGQWRDRQVWIGGSDWGPFDARHVAPHHSRVPAAMADLVHFMARDDLPPLTQAAVAHAQFETIHPFPDGNGRVGRALLHAMLKGKGLTRSVTVPVSAGLLGDTAEYFTALDEYRDGDPAPLVEKVAHAAFSAIGNGRQLVADLREVRAAWRDRVPTRRGATTWLVADLLLRRPVIDSPLVQRELEVSAMTANRAIAPLVEAGVLTEISGASRSQKWSAREVLAALDAFADRSGRRNTL
ncbi:MAG: Fic family protein [Mycobacteriaceae bacterium]|nr:Fic family protein [Mycobacteriaceae bacterium]